MMVVFGNTKETEDTKVQTPSDEAPSTAISAKTPSLLNQTALSPPKVQWTSKLEKIGKKVRDHLIRSRYYRILQHSSDKATAEIQAVITETSKEILNENGI
jgi:hypothetical protein